MRTVRLMTMGLRMWFSTCVYTRNTTSVTTPAVSEWMKANATVGIPATAPPIMGRKSTSATHRAHRSAKGTPRRTSVTNTTMPAMIEVMKLPSMYPVTERCTSPAMRVTRAARSARSCGAVRADAWGPRGAGG